MGPGLRILGLRIAGPKSEGFSSSISGPRVSSLRSWIPGLRVPVLGSQVLIVDYAPSILLSKFASQIKLIQSVVGSAASFRVLGARVPGPGSQSPGF